MRTHYPAFCRGLALVAGLLGSASAARAQAPTLSSLSPGSGAQGSTLTLTGTNLGTATSVRLGELPAAFTAPSATQLTVTVPRGASTHKLRVTSPGGTALSADAFNVDKSTNYTFALVTAGFGSISAGAASAPAFADLNGDGVLELLVGKGDGTLGYFGQNAANSANFTRLSTAFNGIDAGGEAAPAFTDIDGDGLLDLLVGKADGSLGHFEQNAAGSAAFTRLNTTFNGIDVGDSAAPAFTDLDGDGLLDLLVGKADGTISHYEQSAAGSGSFTLRSAAFSGGLDVGSGSAPTVADLDGDGLLDMLVGRAGGTLGHYEQSAANSTTFTLVDLGFNSINVVNNASPTLTDVDGDGLLDLLVGKADGTISRYEQLLPPPTLGSLSAGSGGAGVSITLTGQYFSGTTGVSFNGVAATFVVTSGTQLTVTVPAGASTGAITVTTPAGAVSSSSFVVIPSLSLSTGGNTIAAGTYHNITITGTGQATLGGAVEVQGTLTVQNGGQLLTACQPLTGPGSFVLATGATLGVCDAAGISLTGSSGAVQVAGSRSFSSQANYVYNGTASQVTGPGLPAAVRSLTLDNPAGATLTNDLTTNTALTLTTGILSTGAYRITLGNATNFTQLSETASSYVSGTVQVTRDMQNRSTNYLFGGVGLGLTLQPAGALPGNTTVVRTTGTARTGLGGRQGILRSFDIVPTVNTGLNVTLVFGYREAELNGIEETTLALFKSETGAADSWGRQRNVTLDATANTATLAGVRSFSSWTLGAANAPLPVELTSFTATAEGAAARLHWATASEKNNAYFAIERSRDGRKFEQIGQQQAEGTTARASNYTFRDPTAPAGLLYYRLRQVDADGTASYSPVRTVQLKPAATPALAVFPVPGRAGQPLTVLGLPAAAPVVLLDALGRRVAAASTTAEGRAELRLPAGLAPGVYLLRSGPRTQRLTVAE